jgi:hypothetical protein
VCVCVYVCMCVCVCERERERESERESERAGHMESRSEKFRDDIVVAPKGMGPSVRSIHEQPLCAASSRTFGGVKSQDRTSGGSGMSYVVCRMSYVALAGLFYRCRLR